MTLNVKDAALATVPLKSVTSAGEQVPAHAVTASDGSLIDPAKSGQFPPTVGPKAANNSFSVVPTTDGFAVTSTRSNTLATIADVTLTTGAATTVASADTARREIIITALEANTATIRIGDNANVGAGRGIMASTSRWARPERDRGASPTWRCRPPSRPTSQASRRPTPR